ncbi:MAG: SDR family NAD(P)-dependent oxidoreductase [Desulfobacterales bacterium]|nr:SDR family NAD(P)-dependent oxidoreductase [Desulfobacterales bacterium]
MDGISGAYPEFVDSIDSFSELLQYRAKDAPDRLLFTYLEDGENESAQMTYRDLDQKARAIAAELLSVCRPGDRALLLYLPDLNYIAGFMGCLYAGIIAVPAYPPDPSRLAQTLPRLKGIIEDSGAKIALSTQLVVGFAQDLFEKEAALKNIQWLATDDLPAEPVSSYELPALTPDYLAFLQYTSGSTGIPKGVMVSHGNLLKNAALIQAGFEDTPETFGVSWLPPYHDMGLIGGILQPIYLGAGTVLMSPMMFLQKPFRWLSAISKYRATTSGGPNFAYDLCARKVTPEEKKQLDLSCWQLAFNGAEPVREETLTAFAEAFSECGFKMEAFYPCYGMAETTLFVAGGQKGVRPRQTAINSSALQCHRAEKNPESGDAKKTLVSSGQAKSPEQIIIADPETFRRCPDGAVGEIWVAGPNVARGYWNQPIATEETFHAYLADTGEGPFLRTGDLGFLEGEDLYVTGRIKDLIIIRGRNYYPQDVELIAEKSHTVLRPGCGAAFPVDVEGEERLALAYEIRDKEIGQQETNEIINAIHQAVLDAAALNVYAIWLLQPRSIPKTSSGKLRRHACREGYLSDTLDVIAKWRESDGLKSTVPDQAPQHQSRPHAPAGNLRTAEAIEKWLKERLAKTLRILPEEIDIRTPFSRYGLDSVEAVGLAGELETQLNRRLPPTLAYDYPTIEALSKHLAEGPETAPDRQQQPDSHAAANPSIAIIGMGCRFPGADGPKAFWDLILNKINAVTEVPADRWDREAFYAEQAGTPGKMNTRWGGFLTDVDQFDPKFFGISPREATHMDPQQRLLLETAWEALENAALPEEKVDDTLTGVFIGISGSDYSRNNFNTPAAMDAYAGPGNALCIAANRISYWLNLHGPSWAVDTACSSSLVALHQACRSLRTGECDMAIAGGANMILSPQITVSFSQAGMMAPDGRCKSFDADADGYVRGEGCGVVILKRFSDALADGDEILAVIRGTAVNQDGRSNSLTAPSGPAQQRVLKTALADAGVDARELGYIEAHGTGTAIGDPIELGSLKNVVANGRSPEDRCWIGSVKSNIGHLEAASGTASLAKAVMSIQNGIIPPNLNYRTPTPHVPLDDSPIDVPTENQSWPADRRRLAGISSFGFGGTNAHVIIEEAPIRRKTKTAAVRPFHLLTLSAKTDAALLELADRYSRRLSKHPDTSIGDLCYSANTGRTHFANRLAIGAATAGELKDKLAAAAAGNADTGILSGSAAKNSSLSVVFLFTGQGAQYPGMAKSLFGSQPVFREHITACDALLRPYLDGSLMDVIFASSEAAEEIHQTGYTQPALFAVEYSLARLWESWGIFPAAVMGHSVGEYVAACLAGVFSLEDGLRLIAARGRLMQSLPENGAMAAVMATREAVSPILEKYADDVCVAAYNGPKSMVISGVQKRVEAVVRELSAEGIRSKPLSVSHAFHSPLMAPILDEFSETAADIQYGPPQMPLISNRTGRPVDENIASPQYWRRHIMEPVQFARSMETLYESGHRMFLECGPHPVLLGMGRQCIPDKDCLWLPSLRRGRADWQQMLTSLGELYVRGARINWDQVDQAHAERRVNLPNYPFQRKRYWLEARQNPASAAPDHQADTVHPLLGRQVPTALLKKEESLYESVISPDNPPYLKDHRIFDQVIFPAAAYLEMGLSAGARALDTQFLCLENVSFHQALFLDENAPRTLQVVLSENPDAAGYGFTIYSRSQQNGDNAHSDQGDWMLHAEGEVRELQRDESNENIENWGQVKTAFTEEVPIPAFYSRLRQQGLNYGINFRGIEQLWRKNGNALGKIGLPAKHQQPPGSYIFPPALLDACFQSLGGAMNGDTEATLLPVGIKRMNVRKINSDGLWCRTGQIAEAEKNSFKADLDVLDDSGNTAARVEGLTLRKVAPEMLFTGSRPNTENWLYELSWTGQENPLGESPFAEAPGFWLLFADSTQSVREVADRLETRGAACLCVTPGKNFKYDAKRCHATVNPESPEDFNQLLSRAGKQELPIQGIVYMWQAKPASDVSEILTQNPLLGCDSLLYLVRSLATTAHSPRLWIITRGSQAPDAQMDAQTDAQTEVPDPGQAPLWGLGRVIALEHPSLHCTRIDLDPNEKSTDSETLVNALWHPDAEDQIAFRGGSRFAARLTEYHKNDGNKADSLSIPESASYRLATRQYGILENLYLAPQDRAQPGPEEVEIRVCSAGLNFRDVLNALGMLQQAAEELGIESAEALPFGGECTGVVAAVGRNVKRFKPGDEVIGAFAVGSLARFVCVDQAYVALKPENITFDEAATLPVTFLTAWYGLYRLAGLKSGESVLIHSAAGGVGQAAIQLAQKAGAEIFATASPGKWEFLKSRGVAHVMNSRTLDFADEIQTLTNGRGVDVVFNSLNGDFIEKSLSVAAEGARFVEIGKIGIWDEARMNRARPDVAYYPFDLIEVAGKRPEAVTDMLSEIMARITEEQLNALPCKVYPLENTVNAFRFMAQAKHIGKVVISLAPKDVESEKAMVHDTACYLITGGYGAIGLQAARWLAEKGARHLVLIGRSGPSPEAEKEIEGLTQAGVHVFQARADVSRREDLYGVLASIKTNMPPLKGIIHAAGLLEDGMLANLSRDAFDRVMAPKVAGAWHLHQLTREMGLDFFVLFSSAAALLGSPGQGNYAAANAFMDALAHYRKSQGRPALSVNWGPWAGAGMAADSSGAAFSGMDRIPPDNGLDILDRLLAEDAVQAGVLPINWPEFLDRFPENLTPPVFKNFTNRRKQKSTGNSAVVQEISEAPPAARRDIIARYLTDRVSHVLGLSDDVPLDPEQPLKETGLDSLMAVELNNIIQTDLDVGLTAENFMENPSIAMLSETIHQLLESAGRFKSDAPKENDQTTPHGQTASTPESNGWLAYRKEKPDALINLFCFHHMGGAASLFQGWPEELADAIDVCPVQLPGREGRRHEKTFDRFDHLIEALLEMIQPHLDRPFAFFGHSMGTWIAYELTHAIRQKIGQSPVHLFAAAMPPPCENGAFMKNRPIDESLMPHMEIPEPLRGDDTFMNEWLNLFNADAGLFQTYHCQVKPALDCPITAFGGASDELVSRADLSAWHQYTSDTFRLQLMPGQHMFPVGSRNRLMAAIKQDLTPFLYSGH